MKHVCTELDFYKCRPSEIASRSTASGPHKEGLQHPWLQGSNILMHVVVWPMAIKVNPSWKMKVRKSAWIKPCQGLTGSGFMTRELNPSDQLI